MGNKAPDVKLWAQTQSLVTRLFCFCLLNSCNCCMRLWFICNIVLYVSITSIWCYKAALAFPMAESCGLVVPTHKPNTKAVTTKASSHRTSKANLMILYSYTATKNIKRKLLVLLLMLYNNQQRQKNTIRQL